MNKLSLFIIVRDVFMFSNDHSRYITYAAFILYNHNICEHRDRYLPRQLVTAHDVGKDERNNSEKANS